MERNGKGKGREGASIQRCGGSEFGMQDLSCLGLRAPGGGLLTVCIEGTSEEFHPRREAACQICVFRSGWLQNGFDVAWTVRKQGGARKKAVVVTQEVNRLCVEIPVGST